MKILTTKTHAFIDYLTGLSLILFFFLFTGSGPTNYIIALVGTATLIYSMLTHYELGLANVLTMRKHLLLDMMSGILLVILSFILNLNHLSYLVYIFSGILKIITGITTSIEPSYRGFNRYPYKKYDVPVYAKHEKFPAVKL